MMFIHNLKKFILLYSFNKVTCGCVLGMRSTFDYVDVNMYIWRPKENFGFFLYCFKTGSSLNQKLALWVRLFCQQVPEVHLSQHHNVTVMCTHAWLFTCILEIWTVVLLFAWQVLLPTDYPSKITMVVIIVAITIETLYKAGFSQCSPDCLWTRYCRWGWSLNSQICLTLLPKC